MTLYKFRQLSESEQHDIIVNVEVLVSSRKQWPYIYFLFQVFSFYIESKLHVDCEQMTGMRSFTTDEIPEAYLKQLDISNVLE